MRAVFIYRDPRDQIVSQVYFIRDYPSVWSMYYELSMQELISLLISKRGCVERNVGDRAMIRRSDPVRRVRSAEDYYQLFLGWTTEPRVFAVRFEDLVGSRGGGDDGRQLATLRAIARHFDVDASEAALELTARTAFGATDGMFRPGGTFRKGQIGAWREYFTAEHKAAFKRACGSLLVRLGYEKDDEW
jgi:hypothetical protein